MANLAEVLKALRQERGRAAGEVERLDKAIKVLGTLIGKGAGRLAGRGRARRTMSVAGRRKIAAAQRARWAKWKAQRGKRAA